MPRRRSSTSAGSSAARAALPVAVTLAGRRRPIWDVRRTGCRPSWRARYVISLPSRTASWMVSSSRLRARGTRRRTRVRGRSSRGRRRRALPTGGRARTPCRPDGPDRRRPLRRIRWRSRTSAARAGEPVGPAATPPFSASRSRIAAARDRRRESLSTNASSTVGTVSVILIPSVWCEICLGPINLLNRVRYLDFGAPVAILASIPPSVQYAGRWAKDARGGPHAVSRFRLVAAAIIPIRHDGL